MRKIDEKVEKNDEEAREISEPAVDEDKESSDLPEELSNVRKGEDYDVNNWYFLTRTNFRKLTGKGGEDEEDTGDKAEKPKGKEPASKEEAVVGKT